MLNLTPDDLNKLKEEDIVLAAKRLEDYIEQTKKRSKIFGFFSGTIILGVTFLFMKFSLPFDFFNLMLLILADVCIVMVSAMNFFFWHQARKFEEYDLKKQLLLRALIR